MTKPTDNAGERKIFSGMGTTYNTFIFADPSAPNIAGKTYSEAKAIENNFYAVVGPKYIYSSVGLDPKNFNNWDQPAEDKLWYIWKKLIQKGDATSGHAGNGGALIVNAGTTLANITFGKPVLTPGKYYKFSYKLFVENPGVKINNKIVSSTGNTVVASITSDIYSTGFDNWQTREYWFFLPATCNIATYSIAIQSANPQDSDNDFAIDDVLFEEYSTAPTNVKAVEIKCGIVEPIANDDVISGNKGNTIEIKNIFENDFLADGKTKPSFDNSTFLPLIPIGAKVDVYNEGTFYYITVPNEGSWSIDLASYNYGNVKFQPLSSFKGNPTPLYYKFTEKSTGATSNAAKITATYIGNPQATDDNVNIIRGEISKIDILANDLSGDGQKINKSDVKSITLIDPFTLEKSNSEITIPDEGTWKIDATTKELVFEPLASFTGNPKPINYYFTDNNGNSSNPAKVTVTVLDAPPVDQCTEEVDGTDFSVSGGGTANTKTFSMPATNYGFQFDVYYLDNSFNLKINGKDLATQEIQFQSGQPIKQNIRFKKDKALWGGGSVTDVWNIKGTKEHPTIRISIAANGEVTMYGSRKSGGDLEELELFNDVKFNTITWNTNSKNTVIASQVTNGATGMTGHGSGLKTVACFCTKQPNTQAADSFTNVGISTQTKKLENWPKSIPNGFLALESSQKGLVITRVESSSKINQSIPGMVIYDKTDRCVKLYNGTNWNCIKRTCND